MVDLSVLIITLMLLLPAALGVALFAQQQQERRLLTLYRLSALEKRREELEAAITMFEQLGAGEDILETLRQALVNDLKRMRALDPERRDVDAAIESAGGQRRRKSATGEEAAVSSEQELSVLRGRVNRALQVIVQLQRHGVLSREAVGRTRQGLEVLAVRVGINSFVLMARHALEKGNAMKAFSCYRKAERLARYTSLPEGQRRENLERIEAEKEQLLRGQDDRGLMLLAAGK